MVWFRRTKVERPADGSMSLMEHLYELRKRLMWAAIFIFLGVVLGFIWFTKRVGPIPSLGDLLVEPYRVASGDEAARLLATNPFSGLQLQLKAALMAGLVFSSPGWLYQIWAFVTPALFAKERRYAVSFVTLAALLFTAGAYLAYLVIPEGLKVLFNFADTSVVNMTGPDEYYSFLMTLLIVFGISFLLPLFLVALNFIGVAQGPPARQVASLRHLRDLRLRRARGARQRPDQHAGAGPLDVSAVRDQHPGRQVQRQAQGPQRPRGRGTGRPLRRPGLGDLSPPALPSRPATPACDTLER